MTDCHDSDSELLVRFFRQKIRFIGAGNRKSRNLKHWITNFKGNRFVQVRPSEYSLLYRVPGAFLLNVDHGQALSDNTEKKLRELVYKAAARAGVQVLPASERAYRKAVGTFTRVKLVHRQGDECVFRSFGRYFLSGFDEQEEPPLYFLCRLPYGVTTVDAAREALKPKSVRRAIEKGTDVLRQGDLFFIHLGDIHLCDDYGKEMPPDRDINIYGTDHIAQLSATLDNGVQLVSGQIKHRPQGRSGDHHHIYLNNGWWIAARNTVPATSVRGGETL